MFIRLSLLFLLPMLACSQSLRNSRHSGASTFVYRLSNEEIRGIFKKSFDDAALHTVVDSLATLAAYLSPDDIPVIQDEHVEVIHVDDQPELNSILPVLEAVLSKVRIANREKTVCELSPV